MKRLLLGTALASLIATAALADAFTDKIVQNLQSLGYQYIEIKTGPTQLKAEGIKGTKKLEVVFDLATGNILKQEVESADADEQGRTGVSTRSEDKDFVKAGGVSDDDDDDDNNDDNGIDDDNDDHGGGSGQDDDDDKADEADDHGGTNGDDDSDDDNDGDDDGDDSDDD